MEKKRKADQLKSVNELALAAGFTQSGLVWQFPTEDEARQHLRRYERFFAHWALQCAISRGALLDQFRAIVQGGGRRWEITPREMEGGVPLPLQAAPEQTQAISSYGAARLPSKASYAETMDFIVGKQADGQIVTVMAMGTDQFLFVNGAQVADRGGNICTWIGVDAKQLVWGRSLTGTLPGRDRGVNYYARLHELLERDRFIPDFVYVVTRPTSGALHRDISTYFYLDNYLGVPARVAVSRVGDSEALEVAG